MNEKYKNLLESQEFQKLYPQFFETFSNGTISLNPGSESLAVREYARYKRKARCKNVWLLFYLKGTRYQPILKGNLL